MVAALHGSFSFMIGSFIHCLHTSPRYINVRHLKLQSILRCRVVHARYDVKRHAHLLKGYCEDECMHARKADDAVWEKPTQNDKQTI